ncbi:MAG: PHB depolymerase family esterase [Chitinophagales bacterium]
MYRYILLGSLFIIASFFACKKEKYDNIGLHSKSDFGDNPGNLEMYYYEPENHSTGMPLLVVLHGCSQNAADIAELTEWNKLADSHGFYVLYPEQKTINNTTSCFNWFLEKDQERGKGEAKSIRNMIVQLQKDKNLHANRTFVTGVSAGGAMSSVMISCYPEMFKGGAVLSGGPYKAAEKITESAAALAGNVNKTAQEWGDLVRSQNIAYTGTYPKLLIFHGQDDNVVDINNAGELVEQWTNVLGISDLPGEDVYVRPDVRQYIYENTEGDSLLIYYEVEDMGHAIATDPGSGAQQGGGTGTFSNDKDFYSSYWIAHFFGLIN